MASTYNPSNVRVTDSDGKPLAHAPAMLRWRPANVGRPGGLVHVRGLRQPPAHVVLSLFVRTPVGKRGQKLSRRRRREASRMSRAADVLRTLVAREIMVSPRAPHGDLPDALTSAMRRHLAAPRRR